ncbi:hypothetical protein SERLADRAFT_395031 [Serpula lacrymans var. lacrymans S7.9]|uniref:Uncharacterized protein n=1 Tax=Serpula lacrymans var. lacrymans (strain S7.9) TaxID=578457 RepID=F8P3V2_SERL9|nr:uncharacterized protein SERLADRAFT_395031 [Serpula lacrymans var. lacrymans S7.9]EGO22201.1 hypothetical protein SERLADRAFT_395031 [Serpula lacrymans var. lacrymans S7.9]
MTLAPRYKAGTRHPRLYIALQGPIQGMQNVVDEVKSQVRMKACLVILGVFPLTRATVACI